MSLFTERLFQDALKRYNEVGQSRLKTLRPMRVESRESDGTLLIRRLDGECVERADAGPAYPGELMDTLPSPPLGLSGAAGMGMSHIGRLADTLEVESLTPNFYRAGTSYTVAGTGYGFLTTFEMVFSRPTARRSRPVHDDHGHPRADRRYLRRSM